MSRPIYIGGVEMPPIKPNGLQISKEKIWSDNTGRTTDGTMVGDVKAIKTTLQITFAPMSDAQAKVVDDAISTAFFAVQYWNPSTNAYTAGTFYAGNPTYPVYNYTTGQAVYDGVSVKLIQQ